jgi:hypothetical protein
MTKDASCLVIGREALEDLADHQVEQPEGLSANLLV